MQKISFKNDYSEGAHPKILDLMIKTNQTQTDGYSQDPHCEQAIRYIKRAIGWEQAEIFFVSGGTQANLIYLSHMLRPYQAVISADSGHINVHETGAIEATGHKVIEVPSVDGKVTPAQVEQALAVHGGDEHMVEPKVVYVSNPTELGTIYTYKELEDLKQTCAKHGLYLYIDGARLASALTAKGNDISLLDYKNLCDAFYIGATKCGALFGEALIFMNPSHAKNMRFAIKQRGALLAKGRMLGIQFEGLFEDDLYLQNGQHANDMAALLKQGIAEAGSEFMLDSPTNQLFSIFPDAVVAAIERKYVISIWQKWRDDTSVVRLVTSWATKKENVEQFIADLKSWAKG